MLLSKCGCIQSYLTTILRNRYYYSYSVLKKNKILVTPASLTPVFFAFLRAWTLLWACVSRDSKGRGLQEVFSHTGPRSLGQDYHGPCSRSLQKSSEFLQRGGAVQLLRLKSLPDVWNGAKIPGMSSLLASSITAAQTAPAQASPEPQRCHPAFDASNLADGTSPAESLAGRRQDS